MQAVSMQQLEATALVTDCEGLGDGVCRMPFTLILQPPSAPSLFPHSFKCKANHSRTQCTRGTIKVGEVRTEAAAVIRQCFRSCHPCKKLSDKALYLSGKKASALALRLLM